MNGQIIKIISNLYSVCVEGEIIECRARGKFKNDGLTPLVGDYVNVDIKEKYIMKINERKNELQRPMIANVDACIIVSSLTRPDFSPLLLDKMLTNIILNDIEPIICLTKYDLLDRNGKKNAKKIIKYYNKIGIKTITNRDLKKLQKFIAHKTVVLTGQTGVGKSTLMNKLDNHLNLATDDISEALGRGKHTTRHVELFPYKTSLIADTPGFSALDIINIDKKNIRFAFLEFDNNGCKYQDCLHKNEDGCRVKEQVVNKEILESRYQSYRKLVD